MRKLFLLILLFSPLASGQTGIDTLKGISDSSLVDTTAAMTVDTLFSIQQAPLFEESSFILREDLVFTDYRYTGDFFNSFPTVFNRNYGFVGQPNELILYGAGNNGISFLMNSIPVNDRFYNSFDLNRVQSENIDSIEVIPPSRSFLYGTENNIVALNFLTRDFVPPAPYSRIRYYEGPGEEGMVDVQFNTMFSQKTNFLLDISNKKVEDSYTNSSSSYWQGNIKLKYFFSNLLNVSGSYFFNKGTTSLNGGIDREKIASQYENIDDILYNEYLAPVVYPYRYRKSNSHKIQLKTLLKLSRNTLTEINLYYDKNLDENRQNEHGLAANQEGLKFDESYDVIGASVKQNFSLSLFRLDLYGFHETRNLKRIYYLNPRLIPDLSLKENISGFAGNLNINIAPLGITPSFFAKSVYFRENVYNGFGSDLTLRPAENVKIYFGISRYERFHSYFTTATYKPSVISIDGSFEYTSGSLFTRLVVYQRNYDSDFPNPLSASTTILTENLYKNDMGAGCFIKYGYEFIETDLMLSYHSATRKSEVKDPIPQLSGNLGIYYRNVHFDSSLVVKGGFTLDFRSEKGHTITDPFLRMPAIISFREAVPASFTIDFQVSGEIKQAAILYFTFENILDNKYYIEPYFPMPRRGIRFGVAWELFN